MTRYGWRTRANRLIAVWDLPDGAERVFMADAVIARVMDNVEARWGALFDRVEAEEGIPRGYLRPHCGRESGGNPKARNPEGTPDPSNDGLGLFQITHPGFKGRVQVLGEDGKKRWVGGRSDEEIMEPERNTRIAARYIRDLIKIYGDDFPKVAAAFNAGSVHPPNGPAWDNPWNMHQTAGHVTWEVQAYNYWLTKYGGVTPEAEPEFQLAQPDPIDAARDLSDDLRAEDLARRNEAEGFSDEPTRSDLKKAPV